MGEKRCFVSEYSSLLLDNRKCEKVDRNRINKGFTGTGLKIPKSENRKPSHGEGVCRGKISYETYDRETLGCKPDILVKTWCTGLGAGD